VVLRRADRRHLPNRLRVRTADHQRPARPVVRDVRDHEQGAAALGKNVAGLRITSFVIGGVIAGISGVVLVEFISV
jgi:Branched-chain amino acid transport system / permease component